MKSVFMGGLLLFIHLQYSENQDVSNSAVLKDIEKERLEDIELLEGLDEGKDKLSVPIRAVREKKNKPPCFRFTCTCRFLQKSRSSKKKRKSRKRRKKKSKKRRNGRNIRKSRNIQRHKTSKHESARRSNRNKAICKCSFKSSGCNKKTIKFY